MSLDWIHIHAPSSRRGFSRAFHRTEAESNDQPQLVSTWKGGGPVCDNIRVLVLVLVLVATYPRLDETDPMRRALVLPPGKIEMIAAEAFSCHS